MKKYENENGGLDIFNRENFIRLIAHSAERMNMKKGEYTEWLAERLSVSLATVESWKKGKNHPGDKDMIIAIANAMECKLEHLLITSHYSAKAFEKISEENKKLKSQNAENRKKNMLVRIMEPMDPFSLRYQGYSNIIDMLVGEYWGDDEKSYKSDYAERIGIHFIEYDQPSFPELLGYKLSDDEDKIKELLRDASEEEISKILNQAYVDEQGNYLYGDDHINLCKGRIWERISNASWTEDEKEKREISAITDEAIFYWEKLKCHQTMLSVSFELEGKTLCKYTYGMGYLKPTFDDRGQMIAELLSLVDGRIEKLAFSQAKEIIVDEFEMEAHFVFDIDRLLFDIG